MSANALLLFIPACFAINLAFGPNNLLSLTYGFREGLRRAVLASAGRLVAFALLIALTALGVGAVLAASVTAFTLLKWVGAAYLIYLGIKILRAGGTLGQDTQGAPRLPLKALLVQEFWTAIGNPKAILVFTAFFPQFIAPGHYWTSFATMGAIFLLLEIVAVAVYALLGQRLGLLSRNTRVLSWFNRLSGTMMIGFGIGLLFTRRPA